MELPTARRLGNSSTTIGGHGTGFAILLDAEQPPVLMHGLQPLHDRLGVADREDEPVFEVVRVVLHALPAAEYFGQGRGFLRAMIVGFEVDRFVEGFDGFGLFADPREDDAQVEPGGGIVRRLLRERFEGLACVREFARSGFGGNGLRRGPETVRLAGATREPR